MSKLSTRAFKSTNINSNSNVFTNINQGGGNKKAGFPYQIGREWRTSIAFQTCDPNVRKSCCTLKNWNTTVFPLARQSRPIGSTARSNYGYWHIHGTGNP
jgi:hypothetical protein